MCTRLESLWDILQDILGESSHSKRLVAGDAFVAASANRNVALPGRSRGCQHSMQFMQATMWLDSGTAACCKM